MVLLRGHELFLIRREYHLLLQGINHLGILRSSLTSTSLLPARGLRRCAVATFCNQSSYNQFHFVYDWIHGFRDVVEEGIFEATIWPILLGSYEPSPHRCFKVSQSYPISTLKANVRLVILSLTISWRDLSGSGSLHLLSYATTVLLTSGAKLSGGRL